MVGRKFEVPDNGNNSVVFWAYNNKSNEIIIKGIIDHIYHTIIYSLLYINKDYSKYGRDEMIGYFENLESDLIFYDLLFINYISTYYPNIKNNIVNILQLKKLIQAKRSYWKEESVLDNHPEWLEIRKLSAKILNDLGVPLDTDLDKYVDNIQLDFLF